MTPSAFVIPSRERIEDRAVVYLVSHVQIAMVLEGGPPDPVFLAPDFVSGLVAWNGHPIPLVDLDRYILHRSRPDASSRRAVLACRPEGEIAERYVAVPLPAGARLLKGVPACTPDPLPEYASLLDPARVLGVFRGDTELFVVPDLHPLGGKGAAR